MRRVLLIVVINVFLVLLMQNSEASPIIVTESAEYTMGDGETKLVASQRTIELARRQASEKACVYVESYTKTINHVIEIDEVNFVSASIMRDVSSPVVKTTLTDNGDIRLVATVVVEINPDKIQDQINQLHSNEKYKGISSAEYNRVCMELEKSKKELELLKAKYMSAKNVEEKKEISNSIKHEEKSYIYNLFLEKACVSAGKNDVNSAMSYCSDCIQWNPKKYDAYEIRSLIKYACKDDEGAVEDITNALKYATNNDDIARLYNNRGFIYLQGINRPKAALEDMEKAISLSPGEAVYYSNKGRVYLFIGDENKALECFDIALSKNPDFINALILRGWIFTSKKEYQKALDNYNHILKVSPNNSDAYIEIGRVYSELKDYKRALQNVTKGLEISPKNKNGYIQLAYIYEDIDQMENAISACDKVLAIDNKYSEAYFAKANIYSDNMRYVEAINNYTKAIELLDSYNYYYNRALTYHDMGNVELAINDLEKVVEIQVNPSKDVIDTLNKYRQELRK
ncbi:tetratricopeptide repeat protein [Selenomonas ruminantium]|uniref:Tetratricopeptide repeat-containing protein n=1 Tax=Selenomonas ruminantium TaxID=971 RepID=A0A1K1NWW1_SELRU|nr:tetratricopeptide repeat protein [Selenomonas ruminantium]SFW39828.1 Tetratricopeptide repeat-containing protein [Selenomonas ruminantium]